MSIALLVMKKIKCFTLNDTKNVLIYVHTGNTLQFVQLEN